MIDGDRSLIFLGLCWNKDLFFNWVVGCFCGEMYNFLICNKIISILKLLDLTSGLLRSGGRSIRLAFRIDGGRSIRPALRIEGVKLCPRKRDDLFNCRVVQNVLSKTGRPYLSFITFVEDHSTMFFSAYAKRKVRFPNCGVGVQTISLLIDLYT